MTLAPQFCFTSSDLLQATCNYHNYNMRRQAEDLARRLRRSSILSQTFTFSSKHLLRSRTLHIQNTPSSAAASSETVAGSTAPLTTPALSISPDARFEVLGSSSSLLSVSLSASQNLYTRRGTLVGASGSPENALCTLSILPPFSRAVLGIPFLYQKVASISPLDLLIAPKSANTTLAVLQLDGRLDWTVVQRAGLMAWTGHTLVVKPSVNRRTVSVQSMLSLAYISD